MLLSSSRLPFALLLAAAATSVAADAPLLEPFGPPGALLAPPWHLATLPHQTKPLTTFTVADVDGRRALRVEADASYGYMVHPLRLDAAGLKLAWAWRVETPLEEADLRHKDGDDAAIKVCVLFDLPLGQIPFVERQLLRLARAATDEPLPAATLCYVWDSRLPVGSTLANPFTHRMRYLVLRNGSFPLQRWQGERRDVGADFLQAFGGEARSVPALVGVAVGADADNTHGHSLAHVADLVLGP